MKKRTLGKMSLLMGLLGMGVALPLGGCGQEPPSWQAESLRQGPAKGCKNGVQGSLGRGRPICSKRRVVPVHVTGSFGDSALVDIRGPQEYRVAGVARRAGKSCEYHFKWWLRGAPAGAYRVRIFDANKEAFAFDVQLSRDPRRCDDGSKDDEEDEDDSCPGGTSGTGTTGTSGTGGTTSGGTGSTVTGGTGDGGSTGSGSTGGTTATGGGATTGGESTTGGGTGGDTGAQECTSCAQCGGFACWEGQCLPCSDEVPCCEGRNCLSGTCVPIG